MRQEPCTVSCGLLERLAPSCRHTPPTRQHQLRGSGGGRAAAMQQRCNNACIRYESRMNVCAAVPGIPMLLSQTIRSRLFKKSMHGHALPFTARLHRVNHGRSCVTRPTPCLPAQPFAPPCPPGWRSGEAAASHTGARLNRLLVKALAGEWGVWAGLATCATCGQACCRP